MISTSACRSSVIHKDEREPMKVEKVGSGRNQKDVQHRKFLKVGQIDSLDKRV